MRCTRVATYTSRYYNQLSECVCVCVCVRPWKCFLHREPKKPSITRVTVFLSTTARVSPYQETFTYLPRRYCSIHIIIYFLHLLRPVASYSPDSPSELDTGPVDQRVGLGRVGSRNLHNLTGRVGSSDQICQKLRNIWALSCILSFWQCVR